MQKFKPCFLILIILFFFNILSFAEEEIKQPIEKADLEKQISYALGYDIFDRLRQTVNLDPEFYIMGAKDSHARQPQISEEKLQEILVSYQRLARQKQIEKIKIESADNRAKGAKFLDENKKKEGVVTLSSGLQYKIMTEGNGALPKAEDTVECHYKGMLIDNTVFDSSYQRGAPATFQVGGVIQGWIEALQMMKVGSKWILYIPPDLAYGDRGAGAVIKPGSTLIFEVEVLGIVE